MLGHGYDQPPFDGEPPRLLLGGATGFVDAPLPASAAGFDHGGASGDVDEDGDLDVFVARSSGAFLLINDGDAAFTLDSASVPASIRGGAPVFTGELIDVDADGHLDLLVSGHEQDGQRATIFWGDGSGDFADTARAELPAIAGLGVTVDLDAEDLDGDGLRDVLLDRTGDGTSGALGFYEGYRVQLVRQTAARVFDDVTATALASAESTDPWLIWLRLRDVDADADLDIEVEDASRNLVWRHDGAGAFAR